MAIRISKSSHDKLLNFVKAIIKKQNDFSEFRDKLTAVDEAYAKSMIDASKDDDTCTGAYSSTVKSDEAIKVPIVNSEVDSISAFLTEIFVNRTPLFPVISDKGSPDLALKMQALISKDARQQGWDRQLLLFLTKATRYNVQGIEVARTMQKDFNIQATDDLADVTYESKLQPVTQFNTIDMYNALFDYRVPPAEVHRIGEYGGYNKLISKIWLKNRSLELSELDMAYNLKEAFKSTMVDFGTNYHLPPEVATMTHLKGEDQVTWFDWLGITDSENIGMPNSSYFYTKLYVRIIPKDFDISVTSEPGRPRIVLLEIINLQYIIGYQEVVTPLDMLPTIFCDIREDGLGYQTKSPGENISPWQDIATELLYTRLEGSKRALTDRAIYDPNYLNHLDVNSPFASAKIPLKSKLRNSGDRMRLSDVYYQIPFEGQGVINALTDLQTIMQLKDNVNGTNYAVRGEQRPGNRTLGEHQDIAGAGQAKGMPYAIRIESQVMVPLKLFVKFFILSSPRVEHEILDVDSESLLTVNISELRQAMLDFRLTDGLRPKQQLRDPQALSTAIQFMQNSQELNTEYSTSSIFAELMAQFDINITKHRRDINATGQPSPASAAVPPIES